MISQRHLNFAISQRTVLVTGDLVRAALGVDADTVAAKVESGELRWVWNVSTGTGAVRELRYWAKELTDPQVSSFTTEEVIGEILGSNRERWRGVEIGQLLLVSRPQYLRLHESGDLRGNIVGNTLYVERLALETFLRKRLVNADLAVSHS